MSFATMMVHVDAERDSEQRIQLALGLADRFQATLIGVAGMALRPAFSGGPVVVYSEPTADALHSMKARLENLGKKFCAQGECLKQIEWRTALELPDELVAREARASDLVIIGSRHAGGSRHDLVDPGVILLRAGRPVLVVPDIIAPLQLRRVVVAWKDTRECRRAVRDALPLLQEAKEVLLVEIGEDDARSAAKSHLADVGAYLVRHRVIVADQMWRRARGPVATELLDLVRDEKADLIVAGGYGHSRLGEWTFGGVTHALLASSPVCCLLSH
jgi:nucleotide-binding universal stress UspA family protein